MGEWILSQKVDVEGRMVRYDVQGSGPAVAVVHGTPWSSYNLRHVIRALAGDFRVYDYDLVGYGQSDKGSGDVSLGMQNLVLGRLLAHWDLDRPMVIGHDFGRSPRPTAATPTRCSPTMAGWPARC